MVNAGYNGTTPLISTLGRKSQVDLLSWATQRNFVLKKTKKEKKKQDGEQ